VDVRVRVGVGVGVRARVRDAILKDEVAHIALYA
jgi:hypothetical protein